MNLNRLVAQPIHWDAIILASSWPSLTAVALTLGVPMLMVGGLGLLIMGVPPSAEEMLRLLAFFLTTVFYVGFWLGPRPALVGALASSGGVGSGRDSGMALPRHLLGAADRAGCRRLAPQGTDPSVDEALGHARISEGLGGVSPISLYSEATTSMLDPGARALGALLPQQVDRAIAAPLELSQSLLLVWPQIVALVGIVLTFFAVAYVVFMREEIRA
ncbi:MAG: hypothetical protein M5U22_01845 [Thermoleophilia bacterium]|nr:hypothetical protein [Thermoleophilia bacterium]